MSTFSTIREALDYTVATLVARRHSYIVSVRGPIESAKQHHCTVQIVSQHMVYGDGEPGLTLHLPFDLSSESERFDRFRNGRFADRFDRCDFGDIPCFAGCFGSDVPLAVDVTLAVLAEVYGYPPDTPFECTVYDEGPIPEPPPTDELDFER